MSKGDTAIIKTVGQQVVTVRHMRVNRHTRPMWALVDSAENVIAWCPSAIDAERIKYLLFHYGDKCPYQEWQ